MYSSSSDRSSSEASGDPPPRYIISVGSLPLAGLPGALSCHADLQTEAARDWQLKGVMAGIAAACVNVDDSAVFASWFWWLRRAGMETWELMSLFGIYTHSTWQERVASGALFCHATLVPFDQMENEHGGREVRLEARSIRGATPQRLTGGSHVGFMADANRRSGAATDLDSRGGERTAWCGFSLPGAVAHAVTGRPRADNFIAAGGKITLIVFSAEHEDYGTFMPGGGSGRGTRLFTRKSPLLIDHTGNLAAGVTIIELDASTARALVYNKDDE